MRHPQPRQQKWRALFQQQQSALSAVEFCRQQHINSQTFMPDTVIFACNKLKGSVSYRLIASWQIELLFKEWKPYCILRKFNTQNAGLMERLIWVSLIALLVKRRIGFSIQRLMDINISSFMVAKNT